MSQSTLNRAAALSMAAVWFACCFSFASYLSGAIDCRAWCVVDMQHFPAWIVTLSLFVGSFALAWRHGDDAPAWLLPVVFLPRLILETSFRA